MLGVREYLERACEVEGVEDRMGGVEDFKGDGFGGHSGSCDF